MNAHDAWLEEPYAEEDRLVSAYEKDLERLESDPWELIERMSQADANQMLADLITAINAPFLDGETPLELNQRVIGDVRKIVEDETKIHVRPEEE